MMIPNRKTTPAWHALPIDEAMEMAQSGTDGVAAHEARARLERYGKNIIATRKKDGALRIFWRQINNSLIWVLVGSSLLAVSLGKVTDGLVVLAVVVINTIIGFMQEYKAGRAIEALAEMVPENASVIRDGRKTMVPVSDVVPGDMVVLASGDRVPADMRLVQVKNLQVQESALTGESVPVQKSTEAVEGNAAIGDRTSMAYGGTLVVSGTATALVTATGMETELGRISEMLGGTADLETPLTRKLALVGKYITLIIIGVTVLIMLIGTSRVMAHGIALFPALKETIIFSIALAVGAIPEGLPAIVTIALAIGVMRMARRNAIVRKLPAVETLGSTTVICTDKTGTLTKNEMTVVKLWTPVRVVTVDGAGYEPEGSLMHDGATLKDVPSDVARLLLDGVLCNDAGVFTSDGVREVAGDPTEIALVVVAEKGGINPHGARDANPRIDVIPFESEHQFMATKHGGEDRRIIMKGAPEVVLKRCVDRHGGTPLDAGDVALALEEMGALGMRVLAVAEKRCSLGATVIGPADVEGGFTLVGLAGMMDPPRSEAIDAVRDCHEAGITVKMITGDHKTTARAIGVQVGLDAGTGAMSGNELSELSAEGFSLAAMQVNVFARVAPEHKLGLVRALQDAGHVVAMTGDGVNDAPALKQANIGVAMGITGTSVARESADIVLADDNFASIRAAVEEGRRVYDNLVKSLAFLLPTNLGIALIFISAIFFFPFNPVTMDLLLPMEPAQLLWINMVAAIALALPFAFEVKEPDVMSRPPRKPDEPLLGGFVMFRTIFVSVIMTLGSIVLFLWEYHGALGNGESVENALPRAQTLTVTFVIAFQIFYLLNCRSLKESLLKIGIFTNRAVFIGIAIVLFLHGLYIYVPFMNMVFGSASLDIRDIAVAVGAGSIILPVIGFEKWMRSGKAPGSREATKPEH